MFQPRMKVRLGFMGRARQAQAVQEQETLLALQGELSRTQEALYQLQQPFKEEVLELLRP